MNRSLIEKIKDECNPAQQDAIFFDTGPLLVIAGAGSGKTKTLVYRVARLIHDGIEPERILLLTFTRKSAEEMLHRATQSLDERCHRVSGGTFHAFANIALRQYAKHIGFDPQFTILDRSDAEDLIQSIRKEKGLSTTDKRFPKKSSILSIISKSINTQKSISHCLSSDYPQFLHFESEITAIAIDYEQRKRAMQVMDYDDLLTKLLELFIQNPDIQEKFKNHYHAIMVDEYQDTNAIQSQIVTAITGKDENIMVVGDDAQSIYSFRGAHYENIMKFPDLFPKTTLIKLEQNYRSTQPILDLTNAVISKAKDHYSKTLFTQNEGQQKPFLVETQDENEQSQFICKKILELRENDIPLSKIAVLIRSGWHSNDLELELKHHDIPFVKVGGFKFVETSHVKDILCYCKVIVNPADTLSWTRLLLLCEGLGPAAAKNIITALKQNGFHPSAAEAFKTKKYASELRSLLNFTLNHSLKIETPKNILEKALTLYKPIFKTKYDDFNKRQSDLDSLIAITERFKSLESMLTQMTLDPPTDKAQAETGTPDTESLVISTIHSSKGLEWDTVFLLSAIDGYLPSFQSIGDAQQLEEERRLMYVALTRAETQLYIMKPNLDLSNPRFNQFSGMQFSTLSRFLSEHDITEDLTETISIKAPKPKSNFSLPLDDDLISTGNSFNSKPRRKYYF